MTTATLPRARGVGLTANQAIFLFAWATLSVAAGYRWLGVGVDYPDYREWWGTLNSWQSVREGRFEFLFASLGYIFKSAGLSFEFYYSVLVSVALAIKFRLIQHGTTRPLSALMCYVAIFYFLHEYTQLRAAVAIAFGLLASFAWSRRRFVTAGIWLGIGAMFQSSVLAFGIGFVIVSSLASVRAMIIWGVFLAAAVAYVLSIDIVSLLVLLNPLSDSYISTAQTYDAPNILSPQNILLVAALVATVPHVFQSEDTHRMYWIMCLLSLVSFGLFYDIPAFANRLFGLYFIFVIFLSFQFRYADISSLAGAATAISGAWAVRNAIELKLIG